MSEAYHDAGPSQWIVSGMGHEKEPITAAARRLPWKLYQKSVTLANSVLGPTYRELHKPVLV